MQKNISQYFAFLLIGYAVASLIHFIHNAEFLQMYPGLPASWTRAGVYIAWVGMSMVGVLGVILLRRGVYVAGLLVIIVYALLGMDSFAHYILAPFSMHTPAMHVTILSEVLLAMLVFMHAIYLLYYRLRGSKRV